MNTSTITEQGELIAERQGYIHRILVAGDQFVNVLLFGHPDETISSRCQRLASAGNWLGIAVVWVLDHIQRNHGVKAEEADLGRAELVEQVEQSALNPSKGAGV